MKRSKTPQKRSKRKDSPKVRLNGKDARAGTFPKGLSTKKDLVWELFRAIQEIALLQHALRKERELKTCPGCRAQLALFPE